ncbi:MAG TPA: DUF4149 domain-containing protein [Pyrinomonadaceae bacterium]|jgi:hypothetical protein|nr:DUF4149 domain-containing protein [Pyrinomonadaceae bacterium]
MRIEGERSEILTDAARMVEHAERLGVLRGEKRRGALLSNRWTSVLSIFNANARLLLVAIWLGAAIFFSFAVAPSAFAVLPARELAGRLVTRTLSIVNVGGFIISTLLVATAFLFRRVVSRRAFYAELASLALVAITTGVGHWIINARLLALRVVMVRPIDEVAPDNPLRVAFNSLHVYSVVVLSVGMLAAAVALLLIARRTKQKRSEGLTSGV